MVGPCLSESIESMAGPSNPSIEHFSDCSWQEAAGSYSYIPKKPSNGTDLPYSPGTLAVLIWPDHDVSESLTSAQVDDFGCGLSELCPGGSFKMVSHSTLSSAFCPLILNPTGINVDSLA